MAELNSTKSLGPVMAIGVAVGLLAMITLLPALLVIVGRWVFWPRRPTLGSAEPTEHGLWARIGQRMAPRPRLVWVVTAVVLGVLALGVTQLEANGLQSKDSFRTDPEAVVGEAALARHFPAGEGNPVQVIGNAEAAPQLQAAVAGTPGVTAVTRPVVKDGYAYLEGTLTSAADSQAGYGTVDRLRASVHAIAGADAKVGGGSAVNLDIQRATRHDRNLVVPLVLVVVLVILAVVLRAIVSPLLLVATVVLSFAAALGVSALVFDHLFGFAGSDPAFPLWTFVFLVALGTDYNIFLMTRVHEEAKRHGTRRGALIGLAATGGVITSAGSSSPGPSPPWGPCRWCSSPRSASRSPSGCCWTPSWSARSWSPPSTWMWAAGSGGPAASTTSATSPWRSRKRKRRKSAADSRCRRRGTARAAKTGPARTGLMSAIPQRGWGPRRWRAGSPGSLGLLTAVPRIPRPGPGGLQGDHRPLGLGAHLERRPGRRPPLHRPHRPAPAGIGENGCGGRPARPALVPVRPEERIRDRVRPQDG